MASRGVRPPSLQQCWVVLVFSRNSGVLECCSERETDAHPGMARPRSLQPLRQQAGQEDRSATACTTEHSWPLRSRRAVFAHILRYSTSGKQPSSQDLQVILLPQSTPLLCVTNLRCSRADAQLPSRRQLLSFAPHPAVACQGGEVLCVLSLRGCRFILVSSIVSGGDRALPVVWAQTLGACKCQRNVTVSLCNSDMSPHLEDVPGAFLQGQV